jgi:site-specific DNA recombinase
VWNSTNERLRRVVWLYSARYEIKGKKGCDSRHIDEWVLYQAFIDAFNAVVENREKYIRKWESDLSEGNVLKRVTAKRFMQIFSKAKPIDRFEVDLYFKLVEKITVSDGKRLVVSLLDGSEIECEII